MVCRLSGFPSFLISGFVNNSGPRLVILRRQVRVPDAPLFYTLYQRHAICLSGEFFGLTDSYTHALHLLCIAVDCGVPPVLVDALPLFNGGAAHTYGATPLRYTCQP